MDHKSLPGPLRSASSSGPVPGHQAPSHVLVPAAHRSWQNAAPRPAGGAVPRLDLAELERGIAPPPRTAACGP